MLVGDMTFTFTNRTRVLIVSVSYHVWAWPGFYQITLFLLGSFDQSSQNKMVEWKQKDVLTVNSISQIATWINGIYVFICDAAARVLCMFTDPEHYQSK